jgi:hypothetical protein
MQVKTELAPHIILYRFELAQCKDTPLPNAFTKNLFFLTPNGKIPFVFDPQSFELKPDRQMTLSFNENFSETASNCTSSSKYRIKKLLIHPLE